MAALAIRSEAAMTLMLFMSFSLKLAHAGCVPAWENSPPEPEFHH
jgi:hypothetical protein